MFAKILYIKQAVSSNNNASETFLAILLGVLAVFTIRAIFENDNSKIVSKKGKKLLSEEKGMKKLNEKLSANPNSKEVTF